MTRKEFEFLTLMAIAGNQRSIEMLKRMGVTDPKIQMPDEVRHPADELREAILKAFEPVILPILKFLKRFK